MNLDFTGFICNFIGGCLLVLSLFLGMAPWDWISQLNSKRQINHALYILMSLILFLFAIITFRKFDFHNIFLDNK